MNQINRVIFSENTCCPQPLNGIDLLFSGYINFVYIYDHVLCENVLIESLRKVLSSNPYFSGRLIVEGVEEPLVTACDSGVLFFVESHNEKLMSPAACYGSHIDRACIVEMDSHTDRYTPLLQIKLVQYENSSTLGISFQHTVCDAISIFSFVNSWTKIARGEEPTKMAFDRKLVHSLAMRNSDSPDEHLPIVEVDSSLLVKPEGSSKRTYRLASDSLSALLGNAESESHPGMKHCIWPAYVWKLITKNRKSCPERVAFSQVYNSRPLLGLSKNYFGNALIYPFFQMYKEEVDESSVELIAKKIFYLREVFSEFPDSLYKDIAYWDARMRDGTIHQYWPKVVELGLEGEVVFNNLTKQPIYQTDFGSGPPVWFEMPGREAAIRNVYAWPAPEENGDIILFITLPTEEIADLDQSLSLVSSN